MRGRSILAIILFLVLLILPTLVLRLNYYSFGKPDRVIPTAYQPLDNVEVVATPAGSRVNTSSSNDDGGRILLDAAHGNNFNTEDIKYLDSVLALRGYDLVSHTSGSLQGALRSATAYVIIAPLERFSASELADINDYVARGGKLLLIGDPTRFGVSFVETEFSFDFVIDTDDIVLNDIANQYDIIFNGDYAFNVTENEANFRNIIFSGDGLGEHALTEDLNRIALYGAHTLTLGNSATAVLTGDDNTSSSIVDRPGGLPMVAMNEDENVLAIGDIHFLNAPNYTTFDNGTFISRIARFLTDDSDREYTVGDFPFFLGDTVDLIYTGEPDLGPDIFDDVIALQEAFDSVDIDLVLAAEKDNDHDAIYLGLYNDSSDVQSILSAANISLVIDPKIFPPSDDSAPPPVDEDEEAEYQRLIETAQGNLQMSGTAIIVLDTRLNTNRVVVLASSAAGLQTAFERLLDLIPRNTSYALEDCLVQNNVAFCPTGINNEEVEAELETGGTPDGSSSSNGGTDTASGGNDDVDDSGGDDSAGGYNEALDANIQGTLDVGDSASAELESEENHAWLFQDGPALIDISVTGVDNVDIVIELFDEDNDFITFVDSTFEGEEEVLRNVDIPAGETYTILVRDYYGEAGSYDIEISEASGEAGGSNNSGSVLIIADDDGVPQASGGTSVDFFEEMFASVYDVNVWSMANDGPLSEELFDGVALVIWDSGDFRNEEGELSDDEFLIFDYVDAGGHIFIVGATPAIYEPAELESISDIEVGAESLLTLGLSEGDVIDLDATYQTVPLDADAFDADNDDLFLLRGPNSAVSGGVVGVGFTDSFTSSKIVIIVVPYSSLPEDVQEILVFNLIVWLGISPS